MGARGGGGSRGGGGFSPGYNGRQKSWGFVGPSKEHSVNPANVVDFQTNKYKKSVVTFNTDSTATIHHFAKMSQYNSFVSTLKQGGKKDVTVYA